LRTAVVQFGPNVGGANVLASRAVVVAAFVRTRLNRYLTQSRKGAEIAGEKAILRVRVALTFQ
jgi:hypothetical protein